MKSTIRLAVLLVALAPFLQSCIPVLVGAGVGTGVMVAEDRRTSATLVEDETIEFKSKSRIGEKYGGKVNISVTSFNRYVLLTGQASNDEIKQDVTVLVLEVPNVRNVQNEVVVGGIVSTSASDSLLTSRVKGRLSQNKEVGISHVKVISENGTVFLMGLVTRAEAEAASQTAATTSGAQRVVKVFEYLD